MGADAVTLDGLRREAEKRYENYPVALGDGTTVVLRAPLRMESHERDEIRGMQRKIQGVQDTEDYRDADLLELLREMIRLCADDKDAGQRLVDEIGDDLALLQTVFEQYTDRTQAGEASHSVS